MHSEQSTDVNLKEPSLLLYAHYVLMLTSPTHVLNTDLGNQMNKKSQYRLMFPGSTWLTSQNASKKGDEKRYVSNTSFKYY